MKITIAMMCFATLVWACNPQEKNATETVSGNQTGEQLQHNDTESGLSLNNGMKWKADESTNNQVKVLKETVLRYEKEKGKSLDTYLAAGNELQGVIDALVSGCRMQGSDHDALHLWLEPLMKKVNELSKSADPAAAEKNFELVSDQVNLYSDYFE